MDTGIISVPGDIGHWKILYSNTNSALAINSSLFL